MNAENRVMAAIVLMAVDNDKVNAVDDMGIQVFQFVDREAAVKHIAQTMDGANCYSVSVVDRGQLVPLGKMWFDASRAPGIMVHDFVNSALAQWIQEVSDLIELEGADDESE